MSIQTKSARAWLPSYLVLALVWGFSFYFIMVGLEVFTPVGVAFSRIAFGAVTLIILSLVTKTPLPPRWSWKYLLSRVCSGFQSRGCCLDSARPESRPRLLELLMERPR